VVMCVCMYIALFYRYANHASVSRIIRVNHGVECELPPTMCMLPICGKSFSFGEEQIGPSCCYGIASSCCIITMLKTLTKLQS
jgi:hypothetical protein